MVYNKNLSSLHYWIVIKYVVGYKQVNIQNKISPTPLPFPFIKDPATEANIIPNHSYKHFKHMDRHRILSTECTYGFCYGFQNKHQLFS